MLRRLLHNSKCVNQPANNSAADKGQLTRPKKGVDILVCEKLRNRLVPRRDGEAGIDPNVLDAHPAQQARIIIDPLYCKCRGACDGAPRCPRTTHRQEQPQLESGSDCL